ncbi:Aldehyde/histidinol dehydrogenase [Aspergillus similis]
MNFQESQIAFWNIINGETRGSQRRHRGTDPRTGQLLWSCPVASKDDLDGAANAAQTAFRNWANMDIAYIICTETGKSKCMGDLEVEHSINFLGFNGELHLRTHTCPDRSCGGYLPVNFSLVLATAKIAAALVMGNCLTVKPSPFTPYSTLKFAELAARILAAGVFQALNGQKIIENAAKTLKKVTLVLGGNDATIVFPDVAVEEVAVQVAMGSFFNLGQMCVATKRIYIHESIYEEFNESMVRAVQALMAVSDSSSLLGPLQNKMQHAVIQKLIAESRELSHNFAIGGDQCSLPGNFISPIIIDRPPDDAALVQEEQFGPIVPLLSWKTEEEVLRRFNDTESGLGACVWSRDREKAEHFEKPNPAGYFSGHKKSGIGGE